MSYGSSSVSARLLLCLMLSGCANDRYLTSEQDKELRGVCETEGCVIVPLPQWRLFEKILRGAEI